jgi:hypothetical protein
MKLKKFFAGVLAAAMMLTVGATAAFATEGNKVDASYEGTAGEYNAKMFVPVDGKAEIDLTKVLTVVSGTAPDSMKFNFNVYEGTETTGTALDTKSVEFNAGNYTSKGGEKNEKNNGVYTGTFKLDVAKLTEDKSVGKYTFTIVESMDKAYQSVTAERGTVKMVISKVNAKEVDSTATADFGYFVALYDSEGNKIEAKDAFKNSYDSKSLILSKTVHGALGNLSKDFTFKIKFTKADALQNNTDTGLYKGPQVAELSNTATLKDGTTAISQNAYLELDKEYTVTLRHNDSLKLSNLPAGIKYEIYEDGSQVEAGAVVVTVDNVKYTVTVTDTAFDTTETTKIKGTVNNTDVTAAFQNTNPDSPDMGVVLDNAPYIAMLAIVAIGGVALMLNKRRRDEE